MHMEHSWVSHLCTRKGCLDQPIASPPADLWARHDHQRLSATDEILWLIIAQHFDISSTRNLCCCSVTKLCRALRYHKLQQARLPCLSRLPGVCSNSWPLSQWCYPTIASCAALFSFSLQSFPTSGSPMRRLFASGDQSFGASAKISRGKLP